MRKFISILLICLFAAGTFVTAAAEEAVLEKKLPMPIEDMPVVYYGTPEIDGVKDECYSDESKIYTDKRIAVNSTAADGTRGYAWMAWDMEGLYVFARMEEATPSDLGIDQYESDSFEAFIDEDLSRNQVEDSNDAQYRVTIAGQNSQGMSAPTKFESAAVRNDEEGYYTVEFKCPWLEIVPSKDKIVGFDIQVNDGGYNSKRTYCTTWFSDNENNWHYTDSYGAINLQLGEYYPKWDGTSPVKVSVNGIALDISEAAPIIENGRTLVPMRAIFEALGAGVAWNDAEQAAYVIGNKKLIVMPVGSSEILVNGETRVSDVPVRLVNNRTMVPLRFVSELLGADVEFDEIQGAVFVEK